MGRSTLDPYSGCVPHFVFYTTGRFGATTSKPGGEGRFPSATRERRRARRSSQTISAVGVAIAVNAMESSTITTKAPCLPSSTAPHPSNAAASVKSRRRIPPAAYRAGGRTSMSSVESGATAFTPPALLPPPCRTRGSGRAWRGGRSHNGSSGRCEPADAVAIPSRCAFRICSKAQLQSPSVARISDKRSRRAHSAWRHPNLKKTTGRTFGQVRYGGSVRIRRSHLRSSYHSTQSTISQSTNQSPQCGIRSFRSGAGTATSVRQVATRSAPTARTRRCTPPPTPPRRG
jgi:hypothetical protein